jgi:hypothetical protein
MDLRDLQWRGLDVLASHEHDSKAALPAMQRAGLHDDIMTPMRL